MTSARELEPYPLRFIGNSLSPDEYRAVLVKWFARNRLTALSRVTSMSTPEELADGLIAEIRSAEMASMFNRLGDEEEWEDIKASSQGPPRR